MSAPRVTSTSDEVSDTWWTLGLRAAAAIALGVIALMLPVVTLAVLVTLFGAYALVDGVLGIMTAVRSARRHGPWGWMLVRGIAGVLVGLIALVFPPLGTLALTWLVAAWALTTGALEIGAAVALRRVIRGEWLLIVAGILSILLGVIVAAFPGLGVVLIVTWVGAYALAHGIVTLVAAFRMRQRMPAHAAHA